MEILKNISGKEKRPKSCPKVAIILLNWNSSHYTINCLDSLKRLKYPNYFIILVDNASTDDSFQKIKAWTIDKYKLQSEYLTSISTMSTIRCIHYDTTNSVALGNFEKDTKHNLIYINNNFIIIQTNKNLGFAGGNNVGIEYALKKETDYILLLNNDTKIIDGYFLNRMIEYAKNGLKIGVIGPIVYKNNNEIQNTLLYFPNVISNIRKKIQKMIKIEYTNPKFVDAVSGCCFLVSREAVEEVGLMDENFFLYAEEIEWCYRIRKAGWRIVYLPIKSVLHYGEGSRDMENKRIHILKRSNLVYTLSKHGFEIQGIVLGVLIFINHLRKIILSKIKICHYEQEYDFSLIKELMKDIIKKWKLGRNEVK